MASVKLGKSGSGETVVFRHSRGDKYQVDFPSSEIVSSARDGNSLVITLKGGGKIVIDDFYPEGAKSAAFVLDGQEIDTGTFLQAMANETQEPAMGPQQGQQPQQQQQAEPKQQQDGGRFHDYGSSGLLEGIDHLNGLDYDFILSGAPEERRLNSVGMEDDNKGPAAVQTGRQESPVISPKPEPEPEPVIKSEPGNPPQVGGAMSFAMDDADKSSYFLSASAQLFSAETGMTRAVFDSALLSEVKIEGAGGAYSPVLSEDGSRLLLEGPDGHVITVEIADISPDGVVSLNVSMNGPAPHGNGEITVSGIPVKGTDISGNSATNSNVSVNVKDDAPEGEDDFSQISEGDKSVSGDASLNDEPGADGWRKGGGFELAGSNEGKYGSLKLFPDGRYEYTRNGEGVPSGGASDEFIYRAYDSDGSFTEHRITIDILNEPPKKTGEASFVLDEKDLRDNGDSEQSWSGKLFTGPEKFVNVSFDPESLDGITASGQTGDEPFIWSVSPDGQTLSGKNGHSIVTVAIEGFNPDGTVRLSASMTSPFSHVDEIISIDGIALKAIDGGGDEIVNSNVSLSIIDDVPYAEEDRAILADGDISVSGMAGDNDIAGGDGFGKFVILGEIHGDYGTIYINKNTGQWTYKLDDPQAELPEGARETFAYRVYDKDGDYADASIVIDVANIPPVATGEAQHPALMGLEDDGKWSDGIHVDMFDGNMDFVKAEFAGADGIQGAEGFEWRLEDSFTLVGTKDDHVITVRINGIDADGSVDISAEMSGPAYHDGNDRFELSGFSIKGWDSAGRFAVNNNLKIAIEDDLPEIVSYEQMPITDNPGLSGTVSGLINVDGGADQIASIKIDGIEKSALDGETASFDVEGGSLLISRDGDNFSYEFVPAKPGFNSEGKFKIDFIDKDGDVASQEIDIERLVSASFTPEETKPDDIDGEGPFETQPADAENGSVHIEVDEALLASDGTGDREHGLSGQASFAVTFGDNTADIRIGDSCVISVTVNKDGTFSQSVSGGEIILADGVKLSFGENPVSVSDNGYRVSFGYELSKAQTHSDPDKVAGDDTVSFNLPVSIIPGGDESRSASGSINLVVHDDGPEISVSQENSEIQTGDSVEGMIMPAYGADSAGMISVSVNGSETWINLIEGTFKQDGEFVSIADHGVIRGDQACVAITGEHGVMYVRQDGSYEYAANPTEMNGAGENSGRDEFLFSIVDADSDRNNGKDGVIAKTSFDVTTVTELEADNAASVLESMLRPSNGGKAEVSLGQTITAQGKTYKIIGIADGDGEYGKLSGNQENGWSYSLDGNVDHLPGQGENSDEVMPDQVVLYARDDKGNVIRMVQKISIIDDTPEISIAEGPSEHEVYAGENASQSASAGRLEFEYGADAESRAEDSDGLPSANGVVVVKTFVLNDDGEKVESLSVVNFAKGTVSVNGVEKGFEGDQVEIEGVFGVLSLKADGSYNYHAKETSMEHDLPEGGRDEFSFGIIDSDQDSDGLDLGGKTVSLGFDVTVPDPVEIEGVEQIYEKDMRGESPENLDPYVKNFGKTITVEKNGETFEYEIEGIYDGQDGIYGEIAKNAAGDWIYTLGKNVDHVGPNGENLSELGDHVIFLARDESGNLIRIKQNFNIHDDAPEISLRKDTETGGEDIESGETINLMAGTVSNGKIIAEYGADMKAADSENWGVIRVSGDDGATYREFNLLSGKYINENGETVDIPAGTVVVLGVVKGAHGEMTVMSDGSYSYKAYPVEAKNGESAEIHDAFRFMVVDSDYDADSAANSDNGAFRLVFDVETPEAVDAGTITVLESGLRNGGNVVGNIGGADGTITVTGEDGVEHVYAIIGPAQGEGDYGVAGGSENGQWFYQLSGNVDHGKAASDANGGAPNGENAYDRITFLVRDENGNTLLMTQHVNVLDDNLPTIALESYEQEVLAGGTVKNAIIPDYGADSPGFVLIEGANGQVKLDLHNWKVEEDGVWKNIEDDHYDIAGANGVMSVKADGSYTYEAGKTEMNPDGGGANSGKDTFKFQVLDSDGDIGSNSGGVDAKPAEVTITVKTPENDDIEGVAEVREEWLRAGSEQDAFVKIGELVDGKTVVRTMDNDGNEIFYTITGIVDDSGSPDYSAHGIGTLGEDGQWGYRLSGNVDHAAGHAGDGLNHPDKVRFYAVDGNGNRVILTQEVNIVDDAPSIEISGVKDADGQDVEGAVVGLLSGTSSTGMIIPEYGADFESAGKDGDGSSLSEAFVRISCSNGEAVEFRGINPGGGQVVKLGEVSGDYGVLSVYSDGSYRYDANRTDMGEDGAGKISGSDKFLFTVIDSDQDASSTNAAGDVTAEITFDVDPPNDEDIAGIGQVLEKHLRPDSSGTPGEASVVIGETRTVTEADGSSRTATFVKVDRGEGKDSVEYEIVGVVNEDGRGDSGHGAAIFDAASGTWKYSLYHNVDHGEPVPGEPGSGDIVGDTIQFYAKDAAGNIIVLKQQVSIIDDTPEISIDNGGVSNVVAGASIGGHILPEYGADKSLEIGGETRNAVIEVQGANGVWRKFDLIASGDESEVLGTVEGANGILTIMGDGSYVYKANSVAADKDGGEKLKDNFNFRVVDADLDIAETNSGGDIARLDIDIDKPGNPKIADTIEVLESGLRGGGEASAIIGEKGSMEVDGETMTGVIVRDTDGNSYLLVGPVAEDGGKPGKGQFGHVLEDSRFGTDGGQGFGYVLDGNVEHGTSGDADEWIREPYGVKLYALDKYGNKVVLEQQVKIVDDTPEISVNNGGVSSVMAGASVGGSIIPEYGADKSIEIDGEIRNAVIEVQGADGNWLKFDLIVSGDKTEVLGTVKGDYGTLAIMGDGSYIYTANTLATENMPEGTLDESFNFRVVDADLDESTTNAAGDVAKLDIVIDKPADKVISGEIKVNESDLRGGGEALALIGEKGEMLVNGEMRQGTIVRDADGNSYLVSGLVPEDGGEYGHVAQGEKFGGGFGYILDGNVRHGDPGSETDKNMFEPEGVKVYAQDKNGNTIILTQNVKIVDDTPDMSLSGTYLGKVLCGDNSETGTLDFNYGADASLRDGAVGKITVISNGERFELDPAKNENVVSGKAGDLVFTKNGDNSWTYQYKARPNGVENSGAENGVKETFSFEIRDADNDVLDSSNWAEAWAEKHPDDPTPPPPPVITIDVEKPAPPSAPSLETHERGLVDDAFTDKTFSKTLAIDGYKIIGPASEGGAGTYGHLEKTGDGWVYKLDREMDSGSAQGMNRVENADHLNVVVEDGKGNTYIINVNVDIVDDIPEIGVEGGNIETVSGALIENAGSVSWDFGADNKGEKLSLAVKIGEDDDAVVQPLTPGEVNVIEGKFGVLTMDEHGNCSYKANPNVNGKDVFSFEITDADGDKVDRSNWEAAWLEKHPKENPDDPDPDVPPPPVITIDVSEPGIPENPKLTVYEKDFADGSAHGTGVFSDISIDGYKIVGGDKGTVYTGNHGGLIEFRNGKWQYSLPEEIAHPESETMINKEPETVKVVVSDDYGNTYEVLVNIDIIDDIPDLNVTSGQDMKIETGAEITNAGDITAWFGADNGAGAKFVVIVNDGAEPVEVVLEGPNKFEPKIIKGEFGTLSIDENGHCSYKADPETSGDRKPSGTDKFSFAIIDSDGDRIDASNWARAWAEKHPGDPDVPPPPVITVDVEKPDSPQNIGFTVYEKDFADGSDHGKGVFRDISLEGYDIVGEEGTSYKGEHGSIVCLGNEKWQYILSDEVNHPESGTMINEVSETITIDVKDDKGNVYKVSVDVAIVDDIPDLNVIPGEKMQVETGAAIEDAGNVAAMFGADNGAGAKFYVIVNGGEEIPLEIPENREDQDIQKVRGEFGSLFIRTDGSCYYEAKNTDAESLSGNDKFSFAIIDSDGDRIDASNWAKVWAEKHPNGPEPTDPPEIVVEVKKPDAPSFDKLEVNEKGLENGSAAGDGSNAAVLGSEFLKGYTIVDQDSEGNPVSYPGAHGSITKGEDGNWRYVLNETIDSGDEQGRNLVSGADSVNLSVMDANGNIYTVKVGIDVIDDMPSLGVSAPDEIRADSGATLENVGSIKHSFGADNGDGATLRVYVNGETEPREIVFENDEPSVSIDGEFGSLIIFRDYHYSYKAKPDVSGKDTFSFEVMDADGDIVNAKNWAQTGQEGTPPPEITIEVTKPDGPDNISFDVNEKDLPWGSAEGSGIAHDISFGDYTIVGQDEGTVYRGEHGYGGIAYKDGKWQYTLSESITHASDPEIINSAFETIPVTVRDNDGNTYVVSVNVGIIDDIPDLNVTSRPDMKIETGAEITDAGDITAWFGADNGAGAKFVVIVNDGSEPVEVVLDGPNKFEPKTIKGEFGALSIDENGHCSYKANPVEISGDEKPSGTDKFSFAIIDSDGDRIDASNWAEVWKQTHPKENPDDPDPDVPPPPVITVDVEKPEPPKLEDLDVSEKDLSAGTAKDILPVPEGYTIIGVQNGKHGAFAEVDGKWVYTLNEAIDSVSENRDGIVENGDTILVRLEDSKGNIYENVAINVNIADDAPTLENSPAADRTVLSGHEINVGTLQYYFGADDEKYEGREEGPELRIKAFVDGVETVEAVDLEIGHETVIRGQYGKLIATIESDGNLSCKYVADANVEGKKDVFSFEIIDADGDIVNADNWAQTGDADTPPPTIEIEIEKPEKPSFDNLKVFEKGLPDGSANDGSHIASADLKTDNVLQGEYSIVVPKEGDKEYGGLYGKIVYDENTGWRYVLNEEYAHGADAENPANTQAGADTVTVEVSDKQGNTWLVDMKVDIVDDIPELSVDAPDDLSVKSGVEIAAGSVFAMFGADNGEGAKFYVVNNDREPQELTIGSGPDFTNTIEGEFGTLFIKADGSCSYKANPDVSGTDSFSFAIIDSDGDRIDASNWAEVWLKTHPKENPDDPDPDVPPPPVITVDVERPDAPQFEDLRVREKDMAGNAAVDNVEVPEGWTIEGGADTVYKGTHGSISMVGEQWVYTLEEAMDSRTGDNAADQGPNVFENGDTVKIKIHDNDGNTHEVEVKIDIVDDVPFLNISNPNMGKIDSGADSGEPRSLDFGFGADNGEGRSINVTFTRNGETVTEELLLGKEENVFSGDHGNLTITLGENGKYSYSYKANPNTTGHDRFSFSITDADGDVVDESNYVEVWNKSHEDDPTPPPPPPPPVIEIDIEKPKGPDPLNLEVFEKNLPNGSAEGAGIAKNISIDDYTLVDNEEHAYNGKYGSIVMLENGDWQYVLSSGIEHPESAEMINTESETIEIIVSDAYGNTYKVAVNVDIVDDIPTLDVQSGTDIKVETGAEIRDIGTVSAAFGADSDRSEGARFFVVRNDGTEQEIKLGSELEPGEKNIIQGQFGVLTIDENGKCSYKADPEKSGEETLSGTDKFSFVIIDADGDRIDASNWAKVWAEKHPGDPDVPPPPVITVDVEKPDPPQNIGFTVYEKDFADGSAHGDGVFRDVSLEGYNIVGEKGTSYKGEHGGSIVCLGDEKWQYVLPSEVSHPESGTMINEVSETITIDVKDDKGNVYKVAVDVAIVDDIPDLNITSGENMQVETGAEITNAGDIMAWFGADNGPGAKLTVTVNGEPEIFDVILNGPNKFEPRDIKSKFGTLSIDENGHCSYKANPVEISGETRISGTDKFSFAIVDSDGDRIDASNWAKVWAEKHPDGPEPTDPPEILIDVEEPEPPRDITIQVDEGKIAEGLAKGNVVFDGYTIVAPEENEGVYGNEDGPGSLAYDQDSGQWVYTLNHGIRHDANETEPKNIQKGDALQVKVQDANGNSWMVNVNVNVVDDVPEIALEPEESGVIDSPLAAGASAGGKIVADYGEDREYDGQFAFIEVKAGNGVDWIKFDLLNAEKNRPEGAPDGPYVLGTVVGEHGVLSIMSDGGYSYKANISDVRDDNSGAGTDSFNFRVTDADGDVAYVSDNPDVPDITFTVTDPEDIEAEGSVEEKMLRPSMGGEALTGLGTVVSDASGESFSVVNLTGENGETLQYRIIGVDQNGSHGSVVDNGDGSWSYRLNGRVDHLENSAPTDSAPDTVYLFVRDPAGNVVKLKYNINIVDDTPEIAIDPSTESEAFSGGDAIHGKVAFDYGADVPDSSKISVIYTDKDGNPAETIISVGKSVETANGTITVTGMENGVLVYDYSAKAISDVSIDRKTDSFSFRITDADLDQQQTDAVNIIIKKPIADDFQSITTDEFLMTVPNPVVDEKDMADGNAHAYLDVPGYEILDVISAGEYGEIKQNAEGKWYYELTKSYNQLGPDGEPVQGRNTSANADSVRLHVRRVDKLTGEEIEDTEVVININIVDDIPAKMVVMRVSSTVEFNESVGEVFAGEGGLIDNMEPGKFYNLKDALNAKHGGGYVYEPFGTKHHNPSNIDSKLSTYGIDLNSPDADHQYGYRMIPTSVKMNYVLENGEYVLKSVVDSNVANGAMQDKNLYLTDKGVVVGGDKSVWLNPNNATNNIWNGNEIGIKPWSWADSIFSEAIVIESSPKANVVGYSMVADFGNVQLTDRIVVQLMMTTQNSNDDVIVRRIIIDPKDYEYDPETETLHVDIPVVEGYTKAFIAAAPNTDILKQTGGQYSPNLDTSGFALMSFAFGKQVLKTTYEFDMDATFGADGPADPNANPKEGKHPDDPIKWNIGDNDWNNVVIVNNGVPETYRVVFDHEGDQAMGTIKGVLQGSGNLKDRPFLIVSMDETGKMEVRQFYNYSFADPEQNYIKMNITFTDADGDYITRVEKIALPGVHQQLERFDKTETGYYNSAWQSDASRDQAIDFQAGDNGATLIYAKGGNDVVMGDGGAEAFKELVFALDFSQNRFDTYLEPYINSSAGQTSSGSNADRTNMYKWLLNSLNGKKEAWQGANPLPTRAELAEILENLEKEHNWSGDDAIYGGVGNDILFGMGGDDVISGDAGNDIIYAGGGNDIVIYDSKDTYVHGGSGIDFLLSNSPLSLAKLPSQFVGFEAVISGANVEMFQSWNSLNYNGVYIVKDENGKEKVFLDNTKWRENTDGGIGKYVHKDGYKLDIADNLASLGDPIELGDLRVEFDPNGYDIIPDPGPTPDQPDKNSHEALPVEIPEGWHIAEIKENGAHGELKQEIDKDGNVKWFYTLTEAIDSGDIQGTNTVKGGDQVTVILKDEAGNAWEKVIHIDIRDDVPHLFFSHNSLGDVVSGAESITGSFNYNYGADKFGSGPTVSSVSTGGKPQRIMNGEGEPVEIEGLYGSLFIDAEGKYIYRAKPNIMADGVDKFEFRIMDSDGDEVSQEVFVNVKGVSSPGTIEVRASESSMPNGTAPGVETTSLVEALASLKNADEFGYEIIGLGENNFAKGSVNQNDWSYSPSVNFIHDGNDPRMAFDRGEVVVRDKYGNIYNVKVQVNLADDKPVITGSEDDFRIDVSGESSGGILEYVNPGADGLKTVKWNYGSQSGNELDCLYGTLTATDDGNWTYVIDPEKMKGATSENSRDRVGFTVIDNDNSNVKGELVFAVHPEISLSVSGSLPGGSDGKLTASINYAVGEDMVVTMASGEIVTIRAGETSGSIDVETTPDMTFAIASVNGGDFAIFDKDPVPVPEIPDAPADLEIIGEVEVNEAYLENGTKAGENGNLSVPLVAREGFTIVGAEVPEGIPAEVAKDADGNWTYTLVGAMAHAKGEDSASSSVRIIVENEHGDRYAVSAPVTIIDDSPVIASDNVNGTANSHSLHVNGAFSLDFGADGPEQSEMLVVSLNPTGTGTGTGTETVVKLENGSWKGSVRIETIVETDESLNSGSGPIKTFADISMEIVKNGDGEYEYKLDYDASDGAILFGGHNYNLCVRANDSDGDSTGNVVVQTIKFETAENPVMSSPENDGGNAGTGETEIDPVLSEKEDKDIDFLNEGADIENLIAENGFGDLVKKPAETKTKTFAEDNLLEKTSFDEDKGNADPLAIMGKDESDEKPVGGPLTVIEDEKKETGLENQDGENLFSETPAIETTVNVIVSDTDETAAAAQVMADTGSTL